MNGEELFFILLVLAFVGLFIYKLTNVLSGGRLYSDLISWVTFAGGLMSWGMLLLLTMVMAPVYLYASVLFGFTTLFVVVFGIFQFIEVVYILASKVSNPTGFRGS